MEISSNFTTVIENKHFKDLNPVIFGRDKCSPNLCVNVPLRDFYLIHYVISGKGRYRLRDTWYTVSPQQIFIIPFEVDNFYQADGDDPWDYIWIGFLGDLAEQFTTLPPVLDFPSNLFFDMLEVCSLTAMREEFLVEKLFALYRFLFSKHVPTNYSAAVKNYIKHNYMEPSVSIEQIAQNLGLNRSYLSRIFKREYNCSIQEYLIRTRITQAITYLEMGYDIQQISELVGYTDASNFSKIFKKHMGLSPQKYQQQKFIPKNDYNTLSK